MTNINQQGQTISGTQINAAQDVHIGHVGDVYNNAPSRATYHPPAPPPQGELPAHGAIPPYSRMGITRNPHFVGREGELHRLAAALLYADDGAAQAITTHGIGGMGKSQLAVEYAHRYGRFYEGGVYWVSFADADGVAGEIAACGRETADNAAFAALPLPQQAAQTVRDWGDGKQRLLIFDNCEEPELLKTWQPNAGRCRILLTSRRAAWPTHLAQTARLDKLTRRQSITLLHQLTDPHAPTPDPHFDAIAAEVGDLPLALHLAGSYLYSYRHAESAETYLQALRDNLLRHASMHGRGTTDSPTDHALSLTVTIEMSADKLGDAPIDQLATRLLAHAACLAPGEPIDRPLLLRFAAVHDPLDGADALERLLELGLLEAETGKTVKLHRTIAAYVQDEWENEGVQTAVEQVAATKSYEDLTSGIPARMAAWLPHMRHVTTAALEQKRKKADTLANNLGSHLQTMGDYTGAKTIHERALANQEDQLDPEHLSIATSLNNLGEVLKKTGQTKKARLSFERALSIRVKQLGSKHLKTTIILNNLAGLLMGMGEYRKARLLYERALTIKEALLGLENQSTGISAGNLGTLLQAMGQLEDALPYLEQALEIHEKTCGLKHPYTASSLNNLAGLWETMGKYKKASLLHKRALSIREIQLGSRHLDTAISLNNLAGSLFALRQVEEARPLYTRALSILETRLGADHPSTKITRDNLAALPSA